MTTIPNRVQKFRNSLYTRGINRLRLFCEVNEIPLPSVSVCPRAEWYVNACAYYRENSIKICLELCSVPPTELQVTHYSWPGSISDRTPYGVLCHELAHHCDYLNGVQKGKYFSEYCVITKNLSREPPITSYAPNPAEWFAEMFRVFITNHALLREARPATYKILINDGWLPVSGDDWIKELGPGCPTRIIESLKRKIKKR